MVKQTIFKICIINNRYNLSLQSHLTHHHRYGDNTRDQVLLLCYPDKLVGRRGVRTRAAFSHTKTVHWREILFPEMLSNRSPKCQICREHRGAKAAHSFKVIRLKLCQQLHWQKGLLLQAGPGCWLIVVSLHIVLATRLLAIRRRDVSAEISWAQRRAVLAANNWCRHRLM